MHLVASINYFLTLLVDTFKQLGRFRIWLVLVLYFLFHWLLLYSHYKFYSPLFYGIVQPWLTLIDAESAVGFTHYPGHFLLLPMFFGWTKFFASIVFEGLVLGLVALLFYSGYSGQPGISALSRRRFFYTWLHVTLAWLVINGLILLVNLFLPDLVNPFIEGSPRRIMLFDYIMQPGLYIVILALFFFSIPYIAIHQVDVFRGLGRSLMYVWRHPVIALALAFCTLVVPIIISLILDNQVTIVDKFRPQMVYWILLAGLVVDIFVNFFWMGTAARLLIDQD